MPQDFVFCQVRGTSLPGESGPLGKLMLPVFRISISKGQPRFLLLVFGLKNRFLGGSLLYLGLSAYATTCTTKNHSTQTEFYCVL